MDDVLKFSKPIKPPMKGLSALNYFSRKSGNESKVKFVGVI